jgi:hypothetical protein
MKSGEATMPCQIISRRLRGGWFLTLLLTASLAFNAGTLLRGPRDAAAEVRETPAPQAFQSGSERSEAVLKEILATLKTTDGRLKQIEAFVLELKAGMRKP